MTIDYFYLINKTFSMLPVTNELIKLSRNKLLEMETIIKWLKDNNDYYTKVKRINRVLYLKEIDNQFIRLPEFSKSDFDDEQFLEIFEKLTELKKYYSIEDFYQNQLDILNKIKDDVRLLKDFYKTNVQLYENEIFNFYIDFVDDTSNSIIVNILNSEHTLHIHHDNFRNTFSLSEVFEKYFSTEQL